ncbi:hypothetical protein FJ444_11830 [Aestuariibacter sp. GS-14]|uniref:hypothetical protein n=1 Tax=Aestuariibacter sp. GS-14 TaxID=2590670 RepID=UPI00112B6489|nr:hypothetical protein [Aestuariibacter sp. GS-14]TPV57847.1 hypothetical protein FJ444_11830 [Aestuariibacter sp. GS-14]
MKLPVYLMVMASLFLAGCANKPTVYVYAKYLSESQKKEVKETLEESKQYQIKMNDFDMPASITENTLLYSLLLRDPEFIALAEELSVEAGFPIKRTQGMTEGNHWYTKNSLALFLLPEDNGSNLVLFKQDLINRYEGKQCENVTALNLDNDGTFVLDVQPQSDGYMKDSIKGTWKYRQYPFVELQKEGLAYAEYYFEIQQFTGSDVVGEIDYVELVSLNAGSLPGGCSFIVGTRR